ncbi:hypothetical protein KR059_000090, partial [Drosophila kikkawai]
SIYENTLRFVTLIAGCFYPAFVSFKFLNAQQQRPNGNESNENLSIWLTYWIVYGVWSVFDVLSMDLADTIPLLGEMKLIFVCWLLPSIGGGSQVIYEDFLYSFFSNNEGIIDHTLVDATIGVVGFMDRMLRTCMSHIMRVVDDYLLTRGLRQDPAVQLLPPSVDEFLANMQMERKPKQGKTEDLANTIEKALVEETGKVDDNNLSVENLKVLNKTEPEELVFKEIISERKKKPKTLPKPVKGQSPS